MFDCLSSVSASVALPMALYKYVYDMIWSATHTAAAGWILSRLPFRLAALNCIDLTLHSPHSCNELWDHVKFTVLWSHITLASLSLLHLCFSRLTSERGQLNAPDWGRSTNEKNSAYWRNEIAVSSGDSKKLWNVFHAVLGETRTDDTDQHCHAPDC